MANSMRACDRFATSRGADERPATLTIREGTLPSPTSSPWRPFARPPRRRTPWPPPAPRLSATPGISNTQMSLADLAEKFAKESFEIANGAGARVNAGTAGVPEPIK